MDSWDQQEFGLTARRKIIQIINHDFYLPFYFFVYFMRACVPALPTRLVESCSAPGHSIILYTHQQ